MHIECDFFYQFSPFAVTALIQIAPGIFRLAKAFVDAYDQLGRVDILELQRKVFAGIHIVVGLDIQDRRFHFVQLVLEDVYAVVFGILRDTFFAKRINERLDGVLVGLVALITFPLEKIHFGNPYFGGKRLFAVYIIQTVQRVSVVVGVCRLDIVFILPVVQLVQQQSFLFRLCTAEIDQIFIPFIRRLYVDRPKSQEII